MDPISGIVLGAASVATLWLVYYVRVYLPRQMDERFQESMKAFSRAVELRFPSHEGLTTPVVELCLVLALELGLKREEARELEMAARLRDIGLCAIPYSLVNGKPMALWTEAERATYDRHPDVSGAMLELVPSLQHLAEVVRMHHHDYRDPLADGGGLELPLSARILKVAVDHVWYSKWNSPEYAYNRILNGRGTLYCPEVVDAFVGVLTCSRVAEPEPAFI